MSAHGGASLVQVSRCRPRPCPWPSPRASAELRTPGLGPDSGQVSPSGGARGADLCSLLSYRPAPRVESGRPVCTPPAAQVAGQGLETKS